MGIFELPEGGKTITVTKLHVKPSFLHNYQPRCHDKVENVLRFIFVVIFYSAFFCS